MTPKAKAEELINKYILETGNETFAKQCVLILVNEILLFINNKMQGFIDTDVINYWNLVKQEIEQL